MDTIRPNNFVRGAAEAQQRFAATCSGAIYVYTPSFIEEIETAELVLNAYLGVGGAD